MSSEEDVDLAKILPAEISLDLPTQVLTWDQYQVTNTEAAIISLTL